MAKKNKNDLKTLKTGVGRVGETLLHMVGAPGIKRSTGVSRAESAALAYGMGIALGIGYLASTDPEWREVFAPAGGKQLTNEDARGVAGMLMGRCIQDYAEARERLLAVKRDEPGVALVTVESEWEVR